MIIEIKEARHFTYKVIVRVPKHGGGYTQRAGYANHWLGLWWEIRKLKRELKWRV